MPISKILINVHDVQRSVDFYVSQLDAEVIGEVTEHSALLDLVTATVRLEHVIAPEASTWIPDDLQKGFRHVGFKVAAVDPLVARLDAAGVEFHLRPIDAEGDVRIAFFFDPDGTLLELVEGDIQYHAIASESGVAAERALGVPERPRFDHVALTVDDFAAAERFYAPLDFEHIGTINQPNDPRGFQIDYLKGGDTVLEVFAYESPKLTRDPQLDSLGFVAVQLTGAAEVDGATQVGIVADGRRVFRDSDDFPFTVGA